jgi:hypothetical protein
VFCSVLFFCSIDLRSAVHPVTSRLRIHTINRVVPAKCMPANVALTDVSSTMADVKAQELRRMISELSALQVNELHTDPVRTLTLQPREQYEDYRNGKAMAPGVREDRFLFGRKPRRNYRWYSRSSANVKPCTAMYQIRSR